MTSSIARHAYVLNTPAARFFIFLVLGQDPGSYTNVAGASACSSCLAGRYQANSGATDCSACPPATYSNAQGMSQCLTCRQGQYVVNQTVLKQLTLTHDDLFRTSSARP